MLEHLQLPLPMWRVQFQLLGGRRRLALVSGVIAVLLVVGIIVIRRLYHEYPLKSVADGVLKVLFGLQMLIALLGGCSAVYRAMLRDFETKMRESHRLTPMSNLAVSLGYLFGSTQQILTSLLVITLVGAVLAFLARLPAGQWILGNLLLLNAAVTFWAATVFAGMRTEKPFNPTGLLIGVAAVYMPASFVPGIALVLNIYAVSLAIQLGTGGTGGGAAALLGVGLVSITFTGFWICAAAVKYRRPDLPALNSCLGLVLLLLILVVGTAGIVVCQRTGWGPPTPFAAAEGLRIQWITSMVVGILIACVAVGGAVRCRMLLASGAAPRDWSDRVPESLVALLAGLLICLVMGGIGASTWPDMLVQGPAGAAYGLVLARAWLDTLAACVIAMFTIRYVFELAQSFGKSADLLVGVFIILAWALPSIADVIRAEYFRVGRDLATYSWLLATSPLGTITATWYPMELARWPGLLVQLGLLLLTAYAARWVRRKHAGSG